jgi:hypothetical protein
MVVGRNSSQESVFAKYGWLHMSDFIDFQESNFQGQNRLQLTDTVAVGFSSFIAKANLYYTTFA